MTWLTEQERNPFPFIPGYILNDIYKEEKTFWCVFSRSLFLEN